MLVPSANLAHNMELPPGFFYTLGLVPYFIIPSVLVFYSFRLLQAYHLAAALIPTWAIVIVAIIARPVFFYVGWYYKVWADRRTAAANGAVLAPHIKESAFEIIPELISSNSTGYPGMSFLILCTVFSNMNNANQLRWYVVSVDENSWLHLSA